MMVDIAKGPEGDQNFKAPLIVARKSRDGACILRERHSETLKRAAPPDQLQLVQCEEREAVIEAPSFEVEKATDHRCDANKKFERSVVWKDPSLITGWKPVANFDEVNAIKPRWKTARLQRKRKQTKRD